MKIQTRELNSTALAYAVAIADKRIIRNGIGGSIEVRGRTENGDELPDGWDMWMPWYPQSNWSQGGPIIERERITLNYDNLDGTGMCKAYYLKTLFDDQEGWQQYGTTPLIAAMRCYVASKLGDEVDIPEELLQ